MKKIIFYLSFELLFLSFTLYMVSCRTQRENLTAVHYQTTPYQINVPYFPDSLNIPSDNPLTEEGIVLGRHLFYDGRLSGNMDKDKLMSCATCHKQRYAFTSGTSNNNGFSKGLSGKMTPHVSMPLMNLVWINEGYLWNGRINEDNPKLGSREYGVPSDSVYHQKNIESLVWMSIVSPHEINGSIKKTVRTISKVDLYPPMFKEAFGTSEINIDRISKAIAQFVRTLISFNSRYDQFMAGKVQLNKHELNGIRLFSTEGGDCFHCHGSPTLSLWTTNLYMNNAKDREFNDKSDRYAVTHNPMDKGKYRVPSLRNVEFTAPYMHDGQFKTLEQVLSFYNNGLKRSPYVDPLMINVNHGGMHLSDEELSDILAFLKTLSDSSFITNPAFANPRPSDGYFIN